MFSTRLLLTCFIRTWKKNRYVFCKKILGFYRLLQFIWGYLSFLKNELFQVFQMSARVRNNYGSKLGIHSSLWWFNRMCGPNLLDGGCGYCTTWISENCCHFFTIEPIIAEFGRNVIYLILSKTIYCKILKNARHLVIFWINSPPQIGIIVVISIETKMVCNDEKQNIYEHVGRRLHAVKWNFVASLPFLKQLTTLHEKWWRY